MITKNVLNHREDNKYNPIFMGTIAFIIGLIANYLISKYLFNINILEEFTSVMKTQLSTQISAIQESVSSLASVSNITEESIIQTVLNIMPLILFSRSIMLSILTYFLAIYTLKKIRKFTGKCCINFVYFIYTYNVTRNTKNSTIYRFNINEFRVNILYIILYTRSISSCIFREEMA